MKKNFTYMRKNVTGLKKNQCISVFMLSIFLISFSIILTSSMFLTEMPNQVNLEKGFDKSTITTSSIVINSDEDEIELRIYVREILHYKMGSIDLNLEWKTIDNIEVLLTGNGKKMTGIPNSAGMICFHVKEGVSYTVSVNDTNYKIVSPDNNKFVVDGNKEVEERFLKIQNNEFIWGYNKLKEQCFLWIHFITFGLMITGIIIAVMKWNERDSVFRMKGLVLLSPLILLGVWSIVLLFFYPNDLSIANPSTYEIFSLVAFVILLLLCISLGVFVSYRKFIGTGKITPKRKGQQQKKKTKK